mmetsp:Transcript_61281/g.162930  ORF Transcript_61281/g.162930 Transcript_61281/m.162930 type:complete len:320 (-) Transcript_61281:264-1223(-)
MAVVLLRRAPVVRRHRRAAGLRLEAAPVADDEDAVRALGSEAHVGQMDAVEVGGLLWRVGRLPLRVAVVGQHGVGRPLLSLEEAGLELLGGLQQLTLPDRRRRDDRRGRCDRRCVCRRGGCGPGRRICPRRRRRHRGGRGGRGERGRGSLRLADILRKEDVQALVLQEVALSVPSTQRLQPGLPRSADVRLHHVLALGSVSVPPAPIAVVIVARWPATEHVPVRGQPNVDLIHNLRRRRGRGRTRRAGGRREGPLGRSGAHGGPSLLRSGRVGRGGGLLGRGRVGRGGGLFGLGRLGRGRSLLGRCGLVDRGGGLPGRG